MRFYFKTMLKTLKMNTFTRKEKIIVFFDWLLNATIKIVFLPLCLLGIIFALLEQVFDFLNEFFWDLTDWLNEKEVSLVSMETKQLFVKKFKEGLGGKNEM